MKKALLSLLVVFISTPLLSSGAAAANSLYSPVYPYFSVQVGGTWLQDADVNFDDPDFLDDEIEFDGGYNVGAAFGYDYGMVRLEFELAYRQADVDTIRVDGINFEGDGDFGTTSFMLNGYWDLETGGPVVPYVGGGLGVANVSANDVSFFDPAFGEVRYVDDDDTVFAYQLAAGIAFAVNPTMALDLGYRYFGTSDPELDADPQLVGFGPAGFETEFNSHNVSLGMRINF